MGAPVPAAQSYSSVPCNLSDTCEQILAKSWRRSCTLIRLRMLCVLFMQQAKELCCVNTQEVGEVVSGAVLYDHMGISKQVRSRACKLHAAIKIAGLCVQLLRFLNAAYWCCSTRCSRLSTLHTYHSYLTAMAPQKLEVQCGQR